jgi:ligand-binding sensor domain-containing protein
MVIECTVPNFLAIEVHLRDGVKRLKLKIVCGSAIALPVIAAGVILWRAHRAETTSAVEAASASKIAFTMNVVNPMTPAGMEAIATPASFRDIAIFHDLVYLSGSSALLVYDADGNLKHRYRVGFDLPPAELGALSTGATDLFIATRGAGVLAYNGQRFRQIRPDHNSLADATAVLALSTGRVLIGTEHGLLVYNGRTLTPFDAQLRTSHITVLAGIEGDVWIGTLRDGLFHYHAGQLDVLKDALPDPQVLSLALAGSNTYAGTPLGVAEFRDGRRTRILANGYFAGALAADARCLSVGTEDEGIAGVPLQPRGCESRAQSIPAAIRRIVLTGDARYALTDDAMYRLDTAAGQWVRVVSAAAGALTNRNISALALGRGGRLWVGYFDRGLDIMEPDRERVAHLEDDRLFCINRIVQETNGERTAVASANGLVLFDASNKVRQVLGRKDGLIADHITDVVFRSGGMIVATPAGLTFVDNGGIRSLYAFHGLVNNHIYTLASNGGRTLVGTLGGISSVENDTVRVNYDTSNSSLKHNWITALVFAGGDWFAGTYGAGVFRMDADGRWHAFPDLKEGFIVNPNAMAVTASHVYAGSLGRGLFVYDRPSGRWTTIARGLPSLNVTALAEGDGNLYVGTDNGLIRIREGALQ